MAQRRYSEDDYLFALSCVDACKGSVRAAAKMAGVPEATLRGWVKGEPMNADDESVREVRAQKRSGARKGLAELFEEEIRGALSLAAERRENEQTTYRDLITGAAISTDKLIALREADAPDSVEVSDALSGLMDEIGKHVTDETGQAAIQARIRQIASLFGYEAREDGAGDI